MFLSRRLTEDVSPVKRDCRVSDDTTLAVCRRVMFFFCCSFMLELYGDCRRPGVEIFKTMTVQKMSPEPPPTAWRAVSALASALAGQEASLSEEGVKYANYFF